VSVLSPVSNVNEVINRLYDAFLDLQVKGIEFSWERGEVYLHLRLRIGNRQVARVVSMMQLQRAEAIDYVGMTIHGMEAVLSVKP
jgi:hypothetical protein